MTTVFLIRHAEPNFENHNDRLRELSEKGMKDRVLVTNFLQDKHIDVVFSSPFRRAIDTIGDFADKNGLEITIIEDFKERKIDSVWIEDFETFSRKQWENFRYKLADGECLEEVQQRNIRALEMVLETNPNRNIIIGGHGTAISTIINYYDKTFDYTCFNEIRGLMPWIVELAFDNKTLVSMRSYNLLA